VADAPVAARASSSGSDPPISRWPVSRQSGTAVRSRIRPTSSALSTAVPTCGCSVAVSPAAAAISSTSCRAVTSVSHSGSVSRRGPSYPCCSVVAATTITVAPGAASCAAARRTVVRISSARSGRCRTSGTKPPTRRSPYSSSRARSASGVGGQEPVRAELEGLQADRGQLAEDLLRRRLIAPVGHLADAPRDRCAREAREWQRRHATSAIRTGRRSARDRSAATAISSARRASSGVHGLWPPSARRPRRSAAHVGTRCRSGGRSRCRPRRRGHAGLDRAQGRVPVHPHGDAVAGPVELRPDVVAERVVPRAREDRERAVVEPQDGGRGVDVAVAFEHPVGQDGAVGVDLDDLATGQPAQHVEVVDVEVAEDAARVGHVALVGRRGIVAGQADQVEATEGPRPHRLARGGVAGVEPSLEAHLHGRSRRGRHGRPRRRSSRGRGPPASRRSTAGRRRGPGGSRGRGRAWPPRSRARRPRARRASRRRPPRLRRSPWPPPGPAPRRHPPRSGASRRPCRAGPVRGRPRSAPRRPARRAPRGSSRPSTPLARGLGPGNVPSRGRERT
jgi:hypothetical protein